MAKAAILDVLNTTIGRYINNLNTQSLNLGLWSGSIELSSLSLNTEYINHEIQTKSIENPNLNIPIRVLSGSIEKISVKVPWARITSKPVIMELKGLHITVEPYDYTQASQPPASLELGHKGKEDIIKQAQLQKEEIRQELLQKGEESRRRMNLLQQLSLLSPEQKQEEAKSASSKESKGMAQRLVQRIIENLQIDIVDVSISLSSSKVSTGVKFDSLSLYTTNDNGERYFVDRDSSKDEFLRKKMILNGFGIYCDDKMEKGKVDLHEYIVQMQELSLQMRLHLSASTPPENLSKYQVVSLLPSIELSLSHTQLVLLHSVTSTLVTPSLSPSKPTPLFPEYRPSAPPLEGVNAKDWWIYAYRCIGRLTRRSSWNEFHLAVQKRYRYVTLYQRTVYLQFENSEEKESKKEVEVPPFIKPLSQEENERLREIELDSSISIDGIMLWRNVSEIRYKRIEKNYQEQQAKAASTKQRRSKRSKSQTSSQVTHPTLYGTTENENALVLLNSEERKKLEDLALGSGADIIEAMKTTAAEQREGNEHNVLYEMSFIMNSSSIILTTSADKPILTFSTGLVTSSFVSRYDNSLECKYALQHASITDDSFVGTDVKTYIPYIMKSCLQTEETEEKAFQVVFAKNAKGDSDLRMNMVSFEISVLPHVLEHLKEFAALSTTADREEFTSLDPTSLERNTALTEYIQTNATEAATITATKISDAIQDMWDNRLATALTSRSKISVKCQLDAPVLFFPSSIVEESGNVLVAYLGCFTFEFDNDDGNEKYDEEDGRETRRKVQKWYAEQDKKKTLPSKKKKKAIKSKCSANLKDMSLSLMKVSAIPQHNGPEKDMGDVMIEPVQLLFDVGIIEGSTVVADPSATTSTTDDGKKGECTNSTMCVFGTLPNLTLLFSPSKLRRMLIISESWSSVLASSTREEEKKQEMKAEASLVSSSSSTTMSGRTIQRGLLKDDGTMKLDLTSTTATRVVPSAATHEQVKKEEQMHVSFSLKKLSVNISNADDDYDGSEKRGKESTDGAAVGSIEAHLISVTASSTVFNDKTSVNNLTMGYFWVLDNLQSSSGVENRKQRLVVHSTLPKPASLYAREENNYNILEDLKRWGVFDYDINDEKAKETLTGTTTVLASISLKMIPSSPERYQSKAKEEFNMDLDANFTSLFVNVNTLALLDIASFASSFGDIARSSPSSMVDEVENAITTDVQKSDGADDGAATESSSIRSRELLMNSLRSSSRRAFESMTDVTAKEISTDTDKKVSKDGTAPFPSIRVNAKIRSCEVSLRHGRTDDELFLVGIDGGTLLCQSPQGGKSMFIDFALEGGRCEDCCLEREHTFRYIFGPLHKEEDERENDENVEYFMMKLKYIKTIRNDSSSHDDISLSFGSTQFVFSPETIASAFRFLESMEPTKTLPSKQDSDDHNKVKAGDIADEKADSVPPPDETKRKISISFNASYCRLVLVDKATSLGEGDDMDLLDESDETSQLSALPLFLGSPQSSESIVFQGKTSMKLDLEMSEALSKKVSSEFNLEGKDLQIYTARGQDLHGKVQILEPQQCTLVVSMQDSDTSRDIDLKFVTLTDVVVDISMQDISLLSGIFSSMTEAVPKTTAGAGFNVEEEEKAELIPLGEDELRQIQKKAAALERSGDSAISDMSSPTGNIEYAFDDDDNEVKRTTKNASKIQVIKVDVKTPKTVITVINDLQGLQQGLFKLIVGGSGNSLNGQINMPMSKEPPSSLPPTSSSSDATNAQVTLEFEASTSLLGDYFDIHTNQWEPFVVEPWEIQTSVSRKYSTQSTLRMQSILDVQMSACIISFSEQLLVSLGAAKRMWSTYSRAAKRYIEINDAAKSDGAAIASGDGTSLSPVPINSASSAAAARTFLVLPTYGVENHSGLPAYFELKGRRVSEQDGVRHPCPSGSVQYFSFVPPHGNGLGGKRAYGQDSSAFKSIQLTIKGTIVKFQHLDEEINRPPRLVDLGFGRHLIIDVAKEGRATIIHIRSQVDIRNHTSLPIDVSVSTYSGCKHIGTCSGIGQKDDAEQRGSLRRSVKPLSSLLGKSADSSKSSSSIGIPVGYLLKSDSKEDVSQNQPIVTLELSPSYPGREKTMSTRCSFSVPSISSLKEVAQSSGQMKTYDVTCYPRDHVEEKDSSDASQVGESITLQVVCKVSLHGSREYPFVELFLKPRALVQNSFPLSLSVQTSMPIAVRELSKGDIKADEEANECHLLPDDIMEVFSTDPHLSLSVRCKDVPTAGKETGWAKIQSDELLLQQDKSLDKPLLGVFPSDDDSPGIDFYVAQIGSSSDKPYWAQENQSEDEKEQMTQTKSSQNGESGKDRTKVTPAIEGTVQAEACRTFYIAAFNTAVDHTGEILLERFNPAAKKARRGELAPELPSYINIFSSASKNRFTMILPRSDTAICAHKAGMAVGGARKSMPFSIDDVTLCQGTSDFSVLLLEDKSPSGYYMYKELHPGGRYELHIVHEFLIYNGDENISIVVNQSVRSEFTLAPGYAHPLQAIGQDGAMKLSFQFADIGAMTDAMRVDSVGMKVWEIKSVANRSVVGKLDVETVLGKKCARFVIRVGGIKFGKDALNQDLETSYGGLIGNDYLNFKLCLLRTEITIYDTEMTLGEGYEKSKETVEAAVLQRTKIKPRDSSVNEGEAFENSRDSTMPSSYSRIARIVMDKFSMDYRRFYDEKKANAKSCSLFTASLYSINVIDCTQDTNYPDVLDSSSQASNFLKLDIKSRDSSDTGLVQVDHINLMFANIDGKAEPIIVNTSEEFMWKVLDVINRTITATAELAGVDASLEWDEEKGEYVVVIKDAANTSSAEDAELIPPQSQALYDMMEVKISPLSVLVSFKRQPQASRYKLSKNPMMNYFSSRLQFTIKEAELRFAGYQAHNIRGPTSQIIDMVIAAYTSQLKFKIATLLSSASLQDWKYLTGREDKGDEYVEGDILRLTGNLAGKSAGFILKTTGKGIGGGFKMLASAVGGGIQATTEVFGAGFVGAGVNSVLSGVGGGLGSAIEGVGTGAGKVVTGTAKGIGTAAGGVGGGVMLMAKGKVGEGASSAAQGVGQGVQTVVGGAVEGVGAVGTGLFSGVKKICGGFAGACSYCNDRGCTGSCTIS